MAVDRYARDTQVQTGIVNPAAGAGHQALAAELDRFSAQTARVAQQSLIEQGTKEGTIAGQQGNVGDANPHGVKARAFREAALVSHQAAVQTDIRDSITQYQIDAKDDPDVFKAKVEGLRTGLLQEADPEMQTFITQRINDYAGRAQLAVIEAQQARLQKEAGDDLNRGAQGFFDDATTAAYEGNHALVEARRQELDQLLERGTKSELVTPAKAAELRANFERQTTSQEVVGNFQRVLNDHGEDAGVKAIERWQKTNPSTLGLTVEDHDAVTRQLFGSLNQFKALKADEKFKRDAAFRAELDSRRSRVTDAIGVMKSGFQVDPETSKTVANDIAWLSQTGDPADKVNAQQLARDYDVASAIQGHAAEFRRMPQAQRDAELQRLEQLRTKGATPDQVALYKTLHEVNGQINTQLRQDPRGYLVGQGLVPNQPLDFSSAANLQQSIAARGDSSALATAANNGKPVPLLTAAEADQLSTVYHTSTTEEKAGLLGIITSGAGDKKTAERTLAQLDKQGDKQMALMGDFVMHGRGQLARDVMQGQTMIASTPTLKPKPTYMGPDIDSTWGAALQEWPDQRAQYLAAAEGRYAALKARKGDLSDIYDSKLMRQALNDVMPTAKFNGRRVALPVQADEDAFDDWTKSWTDATFSALPPGQATGMADLVKRKGRLIELGNGRYGVALSSASADAERYLLDAKGNPFVLQFPGSTDASP